MQQSKDAPGSRQSFKKCTRKNSKKKTNDRSREEDDEKGETASRRDDKEILTDFE